jgi:hypothetical protein
MPDRTVPVSSIQIASHMKNNYRCGRRFNNAMAKQMPCKQAFKNIACGISLQTLVLEYLAPERAELIRAFRWYNV